MATANFDRTPADRRKAKREQQYAGTLVHYLGAEKALAVCKENMWHGIRQAILEQQGVQANAAQQQSAGRKAVA